MSGWASFANIGALDLVLRATLLIGALWAAAFMLRKARASAATRHLAWLLGIFGLLALPLIWWLAPPLRLPILAPGAVSDAATMLAAAPGATSTAAAAAPGAETIFLAIYLLGAAALLLRFILSRRLVSRLWRNADLAAGPAWQGLLRQTAREIRISRSVQLRIARGPALPMTWGPMTWGTLAPRILLPAEAAAWPADRRRLVLLHELAHVARCDSFSRMAASLACALYWFHPGVWFAARRMRLEQEHAADDRVLTAGAPARSYARSLLDLALRSGKAGPLHAPAMAGVCQLERRVMSITGPARRERPGLPLLSASVAIGTCIMLTVATAVPVRPVPALPESLRMETAATGDRSAPAAADGEPQSSLLAADGAATPLPAPNISPAFGEGLATSPTAPPPSQAPVTPSEPNPRPVVPPAQAPVLAAATGQPGPDSPAASQRQVYGPQLPEPLPAEQDSDPRIPAALRRGNSVRAADRRAGPGPPRTPGERLLRTLPTALLEVSGILPRQ